MTEICNLACIHCPHPQFKKSHHYGARYLPLELSQKAVTEVAQHGSQYIRFTAEGEPLIHPQVFDMLDDAVSRSGTFVTVTTNGTIMHKRLDGLLASGLHMIDVSIDAFSPETYSKIRGGDLKVVRRNVLDLIHRARGTATKVVVSFIEQDLNREERDAFTSFWTDAGAWKIVVRRLHSAAGEMEHDRMGGDRYPCLYPWERIVLAPDGWLRFCPQDWVNGSKVADYNTTTIKEVWEGEFYSKLRQSHFEHECLGLCKNCPDWAQTRWPWQGLSYSNLVST